MKGAARIIVVLWLMAATVFGVAAQDKVPYYLSGYQKEYGDSPRQANLHWFRDAGFGLFIHYGLYSILGRGEWTQFRDTVDFERYTALQREFDPSGFDADALVALAKKAGMKYITFTSKHHDGFCLFKTAQTGYNSVDSPAGRDLVGELYRACQKGNLGLFLYYSYGLDWHHPYALVNSTPKERFRPHYDNPPAQYRYARRTDYSKYVGYVQAQVEELLTRYPEIAGIWFDPIGVVYGYPDPGIFCIEQTYELIRRLSPHALISFKQGATGSEDFVAPERESGGKVNDRSPLAQRVYELNKDKFKEVCNTMQPQMKGVISNSTWGYNRSSDGFHLTSDQVAALLRQAREGGYNLLLNIGPLPDGSVHPEDVTSLTNLKP